MGYFAEYRHHERDVESAGRERKRRSVGLKEAHIAETDSEETPANLLQHLSLEINETEMTLRNATCDAYGEETRTWPELKYT